MKWPDLHQGTRESILLQPCRKAVIYDYYDCGCDVLLGSLTVRLCQYHQGCQDATMAGDA